MMAAAHGALAGVLALTACQRVELGSHASPTSPGEASFAPRAGRRIDGAVGVAIELGAIAGRVGIDVSSPRVWLDPSASEPELGARDAGAGASDASAARAEDAADGGASDAGARLTAGFVRL